MAYTQPCQQQLKQQLRQHLHHRCVNTSATCTGISAIMAGAVYFSTALNCAASPATTKWMVMGAAPRLSRPPPNTLDMRRASTSFLCGMSYCISRDAPRGSSSRGRVLRHTSVAASTRLLSSAAMLVSAGAALWDEAAPPAAAPCADAVEAAMPPPLPPAPSAASACAATRRLKCDTWNSRSLSVMSACSTATVKLASSSSPHTTSSNESRPLQQMTVVSLRPACSCSAVRSSSSVPSFAPALPTAT
mmetsp:Transcript_33312/g.84411  ORF Transcript_33312/g.84411 Transcript_33312/m.84411 type:complete len:247 (-) Transcript_33312:299-1039(-)